MFITLKDNMGMLALSRICINKPDLRPGEGEMLCIELGDIADSGTIFDSSTLEVLSKETFPRDIIYDSETLIESSDDLQEFINIWQLRLSKELNKIWQDGI